ncbi:MAG: ZIP family metal transporter [Treponema sp.]|nr:ZIP family metal transporter [Treponema sp.]
MNYIIAKGLIIPFLGTALGSALVFFMKKELDQRVQKILSGFAAGVMIAASIWSLLIPSIDMAADRGRLAFVPAVVGFCLGMVFLLILDKTVPHMHLDETQEGFKSNLQKTTMMVLAVTLHNIPEGMAVGILYAGWLSGSAQITEAGALSLAIGIAIQNFPEGAIISMPLHSKGLSKPKACWYGILSGIVEPVAGLLTILLASLILPALPYFLSFAAGAMMYVVVEELVPEMTEGEHSNMGTVAFMIGFALMMVLDVTLG